MILSLDLGLNLPAEQMVFALRALLENQATLLPGAQITNEGETVRLGSNDFIKFTASAPAGDLPVIASFYTLSQGGTQYVLIRIAKEDRVDTSAFEATLTSFAIQP
jgi:hypothetical protein